MIVSRPLGSRLASPSVCSGPVAQDSNLASCCSFIATWDMGAGPEFCWLPPKSQNVLEQIPAAEVNTSQSGFIYLRLHESKTNKPSFPALFLKHHSLFVHSCHSSCHLNDHRLREGEETALSWAFSFFCHHNYTKLIVSYCLQNIIQFWYLAKLKAGLWVAILVFLLAALMFGPEQKAIAQQWWDASQ